MSDKARTSFLSLAIIAVLVFSAVSPLTVHADEGTPTESPPAETTGDEGTSTEEKASTEETADPQTTEKAPPAEGEAATEEIVDVQPTEAAPVEGEAATEKSAPAESEAAPEAEAGLLSEVPENTAVTVLDEKGEVQPLATQAAVEAISTSDPIWCPAGQPPVPGANGCTQSFTSFNELLTFLSGNTTYQGAGTIYVQQGAYLGSDPGNVIDFNSPSYDLSNINSSNLTVTGGWNTSTNTVDSTTPTVFTDTSILIGSSANPWGGSLVIQNITIQGSGVPGWDEDVDGLVLHSQDDIQLENVNVIALSGTGAQLHAGQDADDDVNIRDSSFQQNLRGGAFVTAGGNVNVLDSSFGNPSPTEDRWQYLGLDIENGGAATLSGVLANNNREVGVDINSGGQVTIASSFFNGTKEMFDENGQTVFLGYGLQVVTPDVIVIDNVTGNDNFLWGANLDAGGDIFISNSVFNANTTDDPGFIDDTGLFITGGANVALSNVEASDNRLFGAQIDAVGTVSITDSTFNNNRGEVMDASGATQYHGHGLQINTLADIFIDNTDAVGNMLFGGQLTAAGQVAISGGSFSNTQTDDATVAEGKGLEIVSGGNTSLSGVVLDNNQSVGADIDAGGDVFLTGVTATNNGTDGTAVQASCTHVFGGTYSGNGQYGINLVDSALSLESPPVFANNGAGNIFPANPVLCPVNNTAGGDGLTSLSALTGTIGFGNVTLNSYLANSRVGTGSQGIFIGQYMYVHSLAGLQVFALDPASQLVAMAGS